jgi:hypothetical protein
MHENHLSSGERTHVSNECSCGGANENCFHCYGTGIIRDRGRPALASNRINEPPKKSEESRTNGAPSITVRKQCCSKCSFHGTPHQLKSHELQVHTAKQADCPCCSFVGTESQVREHQRSCRSALAIRHISRRDISRSRKRSTLYQCDECLFRGSLAIVKSHVRFDHHRQPTHSVCPVCNVDLKRNRLETHVRKAHGLDNVPPSPSSPKRLTVGFHSVSKRKKPVARKSELVTREDRRAEQKLDHTRPYAHAYREHGKFGSHPVHDGFDDESRP